MLTSAALRIVDDDGLHALSMRSLGSELRVDPMAAYRHIPNKGILLDEVDEGVEAVMSEIDPDAVDASLPWQDQLRALPLSYLATLMAHPNAAPLIAERSLRGAGSLRVVEKARTWRKQPQRRGRCGSCSASPSAHPPVTTPAVSFRDTTSSELRYQVPGLALPTRATGLAPGWWTQGYAALAKSAFWFEYCSSKSTGLTWQRDVCRRRRL